MTSRSAIKPGDVCLIVGTYSHPELIGQECEVKAYSPEPTDHFDRWVDYLILVPGHPSPSPGGLWLSPREHLKKRPPVTREKTTDWSSIRRICGWAPDKVAA